MGRVVTLPADLQATLRRLFGAEVASVKVIEQSWFARLHFRAVATTRHRRIYLRGTANEFFGDMELVLHEYFHVLHQWQTRELTVWRYLLETFRRGYWDNRFEIAAREFAEDNLYRFRALLSQERAARANDQQRDV